MRKYHTYPPHSASRGALCVWWRYAVLLVRMELPTVAICSSTLQPSFHRLQVLMQLKEDDAELDVGLAQLLQQRRRRIPRRFWVRPWILRRGGISLGTSNASSSFWEAYLSSNVAKVKNTAILNKVLPVISALNLNAGQRWGSYLWFARTHCIVV